MLLHKRLAVLVPGICVAIVLLSATFTGTPVETGPYTLNYPENFGNQFSIPANNPMTKQGVYLGRMLFYEPMLSSTNRISCGSCHQQSMAFTDGKVFSDGVKGMKADRNAMSLANLLWVKNFFWDGRVQGLEEQALFPMTAPHEMDQQLTVSAQKISKLSSYRRLFELVYGNDSITAERIVKAIAQFERTLISAYSKYDKYLHGEYQPTADEMNRMNLFMRSPDPKNNVRGANCGRCHGTPKTFIELFHNNGLDSIPADAGRQQLTGNAIDMGRFRVPTLRNIALTAPYMHDGRFTTLPEVVDHYNDHIVNSPSLSPLLQNVSNSTDGTTLGLTPSEKNNLVSFLQMLTDSSFITDKRFSDPHKN